MNFFILSSLGILCMTVVQVIDLSLVVWPHFIAFLSSFCFACTYHAVFQTDLERERVRERERGGGGGMWGKGDLQVRALPKYREHACRG